MAHLLQTLRKAWYVEGIVAIGVTLLVVELEPLTVGAKQQVVVVVSHEGTDVELARQ